jgi:hypothetical protein
MAQLEHALSDREVKFALTINALERHPEQIPANVEFMNELMKDADKDMNAARQNQHRQFEHLHGNDAIKQFTQLRQNWWDEVGRTGSKEVQLAAETYYSDLRHQRAPFRAALDILKPYPEVKQATERFVAAETNPNFLKATQIQASTLDKSKDSLDFRSRYAELLANNHYAGPALMLIHERSEFERLIKEAR